MEADPSPSPGRSSRVGAAARAEPGVHVALTFHFREDFDPPAHRVEQVTEELVSSCAVTNASNVLRVCAPGAVSGNCDLLVEANAKELAGADNHVIWGAKLANSPLSGPLVLSVWAKIPAPLDPDEVGQAGPELSFQQTMQVSPGDWRTYEAGIQYQAATSDWAVTVAGWG